ncbi:MAG TPA: hypothetical protein VM489_17980 [Burkholderiales bacterium]|nr:hypothetical protein [Burkholderiales bacterium]
MIRQALFAASVVGLAGCAVWDDPYPLQWGPLPEATSSSCRAIAGVFADRGERPGGEGEASLTRELFGKDSPWQRAQRVHFRFASDDVLEVTVLEAEAKPKPFTHEFTAKAGDLRCEEDRLVLRHRRWVYSDIMSGRESVRVELHAAPAHLLANVRERVTGMMFMVVPLSGESARWYRFPRLQP